MRLHWNDRNPAVCSSVGPGPIRANRSLGIAVCKAEVRLTTLKCSRERPLMNEDTLQAARFKRLRAARDADLTALAVKRARRFLARYPEHGPAWHILGQALTELARYSEAEQPLWNALRLCPGHLRRIPLTSLGDFHDSRGDLARAASWYQRAIDAAPNHASGYIFLGGVLARQGRLREAEKVLRRATETSDEGCLDEAFLNLALVLRAQERFDEAADCLREAIRIDPEYGVARQVLRDVERCRSCRSFHR
jgi:tetratricopeptide (TPR) repeat protein